LFPFCQALITGVVLLGFSAVVFDLPVHASTVALALPAGALGAASFLPFGVALLAVVIVAKQVASGTTWVLAGISLIGGLYFPVRLLPDWLRWASDVQPFTPAAELLRHLITGTALHASAWIDVLKLFGFAAVLTPLSILLLRRAIMFSRRRGTLVEY
jgi:ABC-2 type transport system permease protein